MEVIKEVEKIVEVPVIVEKEVIKVVEKIVEVPASKNQGLEKKIIKESITVQPPPQK